MNMIGIDPGLTGAIAVIDADGLARVWDMPTVGRGAKGRQTVNAAELAALLRGIMTESGRVTAIVEDVAARPGQGVASMFRFGQSVGVVQGVLATLGIPAEYITPAKWKRTAGLIGCHKDASRARAIDLYPYLPLALKKHCGRADALLIARYGHQP